jgi:hypothetical protein
MSKKSDNETTNEKHGESMSKKEKNKLKKQARLDRII